MGPSTEMNDANKLKFYILPGLELRPLGRLARSNENTTKFSVSIEFVTHCFTRNLSQTVLGKCVL
jgi:hypothetical protein